MFLIPISYLPTKEKDIWVILLRECIQCIPLKKKYKYVKGSKITGSLKLLWKNEVLILPFSVLLLVSQHC